MALSKEDVRAVAEVVAEVLKGVLPKPVPELTEHERAMSSQIAMRRSMQTGPVAATGVYRGCESTATRSTCDVRWIIAPPCSEGCKDNHRYPHQKWSWMKTTQLLNYKLNPRRIEEVWESYFGVLPPTEKAFLLWKRFPNSFPKPEDVDFMNSTYLAEVEGSFLSKVKFRLAGGPSVAGGPVDFYPLDINTLIGIEWSAAKRHLSVIGEEQLLDAGTNPGLAWPLPQKAAAE